MNIPKLRESFLCGILGVCLLLLYSVSFAQQLPKVTKAGRHFVFSIPEGADGTYDVPLFPLQEERRLTVYSQFDGCGYLSSPNGYYQEFTFLKGLPTDVLIPESQELLNVDGKSDRGIIIYTSEPVNCVFHWYAASAGDATQLYPDEVLGTDYLVPAWGIFNDFDENNKTEITITASQDNTAVTFTPTANLLPNHPAGVPITFTLNRGECYIARSDINAPNSTVSLSRSTVKATKPVSVISNNTCAYVPLEEQSCNEILDEILPKQYWGKEFFARPLSNDGFSTYALVTSDVKPLLVFADGVTYFGSNGQAIIQITKPIQIITTDSAQCHLLTSGSSTVLFGNSSSDPSMITLLPQSQWSDTLNWCTPRYDFQHYLVAIYDSASEPNIQLDGRPIATQGVREPIEGTDKITMHAEVVRGIHRITSPTPVLGIATGFLTADAYTFLPGSPAPFEQHDTIRRELILSSADSCNEIVVTGTLDTTFTAHDSLHYAELQFQYDPRLILRSVDLSGPLTAGNTQFSVDSSTAGIVFVALITTDPLLGGNKIIQLHFELIDTFTNLEVKSSPFFSQFGHCPEPPVHSGDTAIKLGYVYYPPSNQVLTELSTTKNVSMIGTKDTLVVDLTQLPGDAAINNFSIDLKFNDDLIDLKQVLTNNTLTDGWQSAITRNGVGDYTVSFTSSQQLAGTGTLAKFVFTSYVTVVDSTVLSYAPHFNSGRVCPYTLSSPMQQTGLLVTGECEDSVIKAFMTTNTVIIDAIHPNPSSGSFSIDLPSDAHNLELEVYDLLGNLKWKQTVSQAAGRQTFQLPERVASGNYVIRTRLNGFSRSFQLKVVR